MNSSLALPAVAALEQRAVEAMRRGQGREALALWQQVLALMPNHAAALTQVAQAAFQQGEFAAARREFERAAAADGSDPRQWVNVALACQRLGDEAGEEQALTKALTVDPMDLLALLMRGQLRERQGRSRDAASAYGAAAAVAPPMDRLMPELRPLLGHALEFREQHLQRFAAFMDERLADTLRGADPAGSERFKLSLDIMLGRKQRFDPQPMRFYVPQLPVQEFFDRARFPWLDVMEAATADIRGEFLAVLAEDSPAFVPYIQYGQDMPVAQWSELNHSLRWSVLHLVKDGVTVPENASRCPKTMAAWAHTPRPDQPGRTPVLLYSMLEPRSRIPPHVGASNARLIVHLPLIVPEGCRYRVGNSVRQWVPGKAWVFDDTIEHEAINDSDQIRVVVIFDTWHPDLNDEERRLITAMNTALEEFSGPHREKYDA